MKTAFVIINGIQFPYSLVDHAIDWAKREGGNLYALFLSDAGEVPEGYVFPSDIDLAETLNNEEDAEKDTAVIIGHQMKLFSDTAKTKDISAQSESMIDPALTDVLEKASKATLLFIPAGFDETELSAVTHFNLQELVDKAPCPVEIVEED
jgi:hypothetical protein